MHISVIIPAKDRFEKLAVSLGILKEQLRDNDEIIVVDDGSLTEFPENINKFFEDKRLKLIKLEKNMGPAFARNKAIDSAKNEILLFTGDDIYPDKGFLEAHREAHKKLNDECCAVLGKTEWHKGLKVTPFMEYITEKGGEQFAYFRLKDGQDAGYGFFYTSNISILKSFLGSDRFDEFFPYAAYEDIELGYRLSKRGLKVIYTSKALAFHDHFVTPRQFAVRQYRAGRSFYYFAKKYPELWVQFEKTDFSMGVVGKDKESGLPDEAEEAVKKGEFEKAARIFSVYLRSHMYYGIEESVKENSMGVEIKHDGNSWGIYGGNKRLTSARNPQREAEIIAESVPGGKNIILAGAGTGEIVAACAKRAGDSEVYIYEPCETLRIYSAKKTVSYKNVRYLENPEEGRKKFLEGAVPVIIPALKNFGNAYSAFYNGLVNNFVMQNSGKQLKVLVISPLYGGSYDMSYYAAEGFRENGCEAEVYDTSFFYESFRKLEGEEFGGRGNALQSAMIEIITKSVIKKALAFKPDLVFCMAQSPVSAQTAFEIRKNGIMTAFWFVEDNRLFPYWKGICNAHDYFFVIQKGDFLDTLKKSGSNAFFLPVAAQTKEQGKIKAGIQEYSSDISVVAAPYRNRVSILSGLRRIRPAVFGDGWNLYAGRIKADIRLGGRRLTGKEVEMVYFNSAVNINLHSSPFFDGIDEYKDFINPRTFEIPACGGFQIVDLRNDLYVFFEKDSEIVTFNTPEEMEDKALYYLKRPDYRKKITLAAAERIKKEHTYAARMKSVLDLVKYGVELAKV